MFDSRLPELLTRMRDCLDKKNIGGAHITLDRITEEWEAIQAALEKQRDRAEDIQKALDTLSEGVW